MVVGDQRMDAAPFPRSGLCRHQTGVKFRLPTIDGAGANSSCRRRTSTTAATRSCCAAISLWDDTGDGAAAGRAGVSRGAGPRRFRDGEGAHAGRARLCRARRRHVRRAAPGAQPAGSRNPRRRSARRAGKTARPRPRRAGDARGLPQVDANRLAAIGFCFGGSVVLELAREGADLKAAVSFHGVLTTKMPAAPGR